jgi:hypothetical protein
LPHTPTSQHDQWPLLDAAAWLRLPVLPRSHSLPASVFLSNSLEWHEGTRGPSTALCPLHCRGRLLGNLSDCTPVATTARCSSLPHTEPPAVRPAFHLTMTNELRTKGQQNSTHRGGDIRVNQGTHLSACLSFPQTAHHHSCPSVPTLSSPAAKNHQELQLHCLSVCPSACPTHQHGTLSYLPNHRST